MSEGQFHILPVYFVFETAEAAERWKNAHFPNVLLQHCSDSVSEAPRTLWIDEAVTYLGLDRIGITRPQRAIHRLINKGALHPNKISGRLVFDREELDKVLANGDHKRGRGRPRKL